MRAPLIAGNWKMHTTVFEAVALADRFRPALAPYTSVEVVLCPPFVSLTAVSRVIRDSGLRLGAQNMHFEDKGAITGEISPVMLEGLCDYVILAHSERRALFGETDEMANKKTAAAFRHGLAPIVCVGEVLAEYEAGLTDAVVTRQVQTSLGALPADAIERLVVAYEPVWAIGTGRAATGPGAARVIRRIRDLLAEMYGPAAAERIRILYGGSVTGQNAGDFVRYEEIDGALVGGASLKDDFVEIVRVTAEAKG